MLRVLGSPKRLCNGLTRRDFLEIGGLGVLGVGLSDLLRAAQAQAAPGTGVLNSSFGKAKRCILLYLYGSPSQLETFDVKPEAPVEIRGELKSIPTSIPGFHIGELLPETAKIIDRTTVVRSMTHPYPVHGIAYATTGLPDPVSGNVEVTPRDQRHWPYIGSVVDYIEEHQRPGVTPPLPSNIALPFPLSTRRTNQPHRAGPYGGFLGSAYDPIWTEFHGDGTKPFMQENRGVVQEFRDPYAGIKPDCRFELSSAGPSDGAITLDRLNRRRSLRRRRNGRRSRCGEDGPHRIGRGRNAHLTQRHPRHDLPSARHRSPQRNPRPAGPPLPDRWLGNRPARIADMTCAG